LLAAALLIVAPLRAQEESVHLEYDASSGCPDRSAFIAEVTARTSRARFVDETHDVRTFQATIRTQGERTVGSLLSNSGQSGAERKVSGKTCAEVVSALALITALAIDPSASTRPAVAQPSTEAPKAKADEAPSTIAANPAPPVAPRDTSKAKKSSSWGFGVGAGAEGSYGLSTDGAALVMFGGSVLAEAGPALEEEWGPLLRASGFFARSPTVDPAASAQPTGSATFTLFAGRLAISPAAMRVAHHFELLPWLRAELGQLRGEGIKGGIVQNPQSQTATWVAVGQALEGRLHAGSALWLSLEVSAVEPLVRQSFVFENPRTPIRSIPAFAPALGVLVGGRIL
jgi:hypothetical protein